MKRNICFSKKEYTFLQQRLPLDFLAERILKNNTLNPFKNEVSHPLNSQFSILNSQFYTTYPALRAPLPQVEGEWGLNP